MSKRNRHAQKNVILSSALSDDFSADEVAAYTRQLSRACHVVYEDHVGNTHLKIFSQHRNLSEDRLMELLVVPGEMCWGSLHTADRGEVGYIGACFDLKQSHSETDIPHTYIRMAWPRGDKGTLSDRLRQLERSTSGDLSFWKALVGSLLAAECHHQNASGTSEDAVWSGLPAQYALLTTRFAWSHGRAASKRDALHLAQVYLKSVTPDNSQRIAPWTLDAVSTAQVLLALSQQLWDAQFRRRLARYSAGFTQDIETWATLVHLANCWLHLVKQRHLDIDVSGVRLRCGPGEDCNLKEWQPVIELERWNIPPQALHYLKGRKKPGEEIHEVALIPNYDLVYGDALAEQLLADARQNAVFVPSGAFRLSLPTGMPVANFQELCLWTDGKGLWVLPKPGGSIFYWRPEHPSVLGAPLWDEAPASAMHLLLSALWRDLVVGGEQVFAQLDHERVASVAVKHRRKSSSRQKPPSTLYLPSVRKLDLEGHCAWGSPEEVEKIHLRAHQVRGHVRRLLPGQKASSQARQNAERFGFLIPSGHTFVRPHTAGLKSEDEAVPETRIAALGLASLLVMGHNRMERAQ